MKQLARDGFSLIELLVVISIIVLLSTVVFGFLIQARNKARTIATIKEVDQVRTALELYYLIHKAYPDPAPQSASHPLGYNEQSSWCKWDIGGIVPAEVALPHPIPTEIDNNNNGIPLLDPLVQENLISSTWFAGNTPHFMIYGAGNTSGAVDGMGPCNCVLSRDADYILLAYNLEPIPGLTDNDECEYIQDGSHPNSNWASNCSGETGPTNYCYIKRR